MVVRVAVAYDGDVNNLQERRKSVEEALKHFYARILLAGPVSMPSYTAAATPAMKVILSTSNKRCRLHQDAWQRGCPDRWRMPRTG